MKLTSERMAELFKKFTETKYETGPYLRVCVGSWYAYNACNKHALGTNYKGVYYIDFFELDGSEELGDVLETLGWDKFEQEELFVQDYESDFLDIKNCDFENPMELADFIAEHKREIENESDKIAAIMEATGDDIKGALDHIDDYIFYADMSAEDYKRMEVEESGREIPQWLEYYIDFAAMARDDILSGYMDEVNDGVLIRC